ncbi:MAG: META domain-containing protein [Gaiellaceae bacterium]
MTEPFGPLPSLGGTRWLLSELGGEHVPPGDENRAPHLVLDLEDSRLAGSGGCNRLMGSFELDGEALRFGPVATTMLHCGDEVMALERAFLDALEATQAYGVDGSTLELLDGDRVLARFEPAVSALP